MKAAFRLQIYQQQQDRGPTTGQAAQQTVNLGFFPTSQAIAAAGLRGNLHQTEQASDISGLDALPVVNEGDEMPDAAQLLCSSA